METEYAEVLYQLEQIESGMREVESSCHGLISSLDQKNHLSAGNFLKYLYFRSHDQRTLQEKLHDAGLSSLTAAESHIHRQVQEVMQRLGKETPADKLDRKTGSNIIQANSAALFGDRFDNQHPAIMVTYETGLATDALAVRELIEAGMQVARINCAHDNEDIWKNMISLTREQAAHAGKTVKIYMDLAGPKIRTMINSSGRKKEKISLLEGEILPLLDRSPINEHAIGCSLTGIVSNLKEGQKVYFDDGRIQASVVSVNGKEALIRIERITGKPRLKSEKGINFPDTEIPFHGLTDYDRKCIPFIAENSDMLGFSFVRTPKDIENLRNEFNSRNLKLLPYVLKIETSEAVKNLPALLLESMKDKHSGVMIARGDLALEISFERLSEIQEEIIWLCEAAHVPVIWATQVLDSLNKSGLATRSEATDAAMAAFADCVMLNKGRNIRKVLDTLSDILKRSSSHRLKKRYLMRPLSIAENHYRNIMPGPTDI